MTEKPEKKHYIVIEVSKERKQQAEIQAEKEGLGLAPWARRTLYKALEEAA